MILVLAICFSALPLVWAALDLWVLAAMDTESDR